MQIQILIPSQNQRTFTIDVDKEETVSSFRKLMSKTLNVPENSFLLIALGKIMIDRCSDNKPATLFSTYRVKNKTCVFVHLTMTKRKSEKKVKENTVKKRRKLDLPNINRDNNVVTSPFEAFECSECNSDKNKKTCSECGCIKCHLKTGDPLICDQCDGYWHLHCAGINKIPSEQYWYCPDCYNNDHTVIIGKGKAVQSTQNSPKNAIQIRDNECIIVPTWHAGKIPGIYCGQSWAYRSLLSDWGVHRSNRYTVCGSVYIGAVSLVLTYGNLIERDDGYEFVLIGTGEPNQKENLSYNKHYDNQTLSRSNLALAITCDTPLNTVKGGKANNWRMSRPIRVCRSSTIEDCHPTFSPAKGFRYDGLYKLVKYWPYQVSKSSKIGWKFMFRRDDQEAPPWTAVGRRLNTKRGIHMFGEGADSKEGRKVKYVIPNHIQRFMKSDLKNKRLWKQVKKMEFWSEYEFLHYIFDEAVVCSSNACSKPIKDPITTPCGHICCIRCLKASNSDRCFTCRATIPAKSVQVSRPLVKILKALNWAYDSKPPVTNKIKTEELNDEDGNVFVKKESTDIQLYPELHDESSSNIRKFRKVRVYIENLGNQQDKNLGCSSL